MAQNHFFGLPQQIKEKGGNTPSQRCDSALEGIAKQMQQDQSEAVQQYGQDLVSVKTNLVNAIQQGG